MNIFQALLCICYVLRCYSQECGAPASSKQLLQVSHTTKEQEGYNLCIVHDNNCIDLYLDPTWDDGITGNQMENLDVSSAQLVVARYDEDLRWLDALPQVPAVVYNRGDEAVGMLPRPRANLQILRQANDGREDQVFLKHIYENYYNLSEATVFLQGWPLGHCPGFFQAVRRAITAVLAPELSGPTTAGFVEGLAPVTGTFWQYEVEVGRIGLAGQMARRQMSPQHGSEAEAEAKEAYQQLCRQILGERPCPRLQWVAEGAQWAVSSQRVRSTSREIYGRALSLGEGWQGKFRGLVLEALWPILFGAVNWAPTQVDYLPLLAANAYNRARSNDDYCKLDLKDQKTHTRNLVFSCTARVEYCERQRRLGDVQSTSFEADRLRYEIYDPVGFIPWHMNAVLKPVLFGSSRFWPRNSPQGELASQALSDAGYNGVVVEVAGRVQLPEGGRKMNPVLWSISDATGGFTFSRINELQEQHFLGCNGDQAVMQREAHVWTLKSLMDGWVRLFNAQEQRWLSLDNRQDGAFLYCLEAIHNDYDASMDQSVFVIEASRKEVSDVQSPAA